MYCTIKKPYFAVIFPHMGLELRPYMCILYIYICICICMVGTSNLGSWNGHWLQLVNPFPVPRFTPEVTRRRSFPSDQQLAAVADWNCGLSVEGNLWEIYGKSMGNLWEIIGKPPGKCCFWMGFYRIYPLVMTNMAMENGHSNREFSHEKLWFSIAM